MCLLPCWKVLAVYMCVMCIKMIDWKSVAIEMRLVITLLDANPFIFSDLFIMSSLFYNE